MQVIPEAATGVNSKLCFHCGTEVASVSIQRSSFENENDMKHFCCEGCATAYDIVSGSGNWNYYRFRTDYAPRPEEGDDELFRLHDESIALDSMGCKSSELLVEGIHCASCVWLSEQILGSVPGVRNVEVQLATNRAHLTWDARQTNLPEIASALGRTGYQLIPIAGKTQPGAAGTSRDLLKRLTTAGFFSGNIMLVSVSLYAGFFGQMDSLTKDFFHLVSALLTLPVFFYSARPFFRNALLAIRHRMLAMDVLTATGISIAFFYSCFVALTRSGEVYFDSVCFVTFFILSGRYIESRLKLKGLYYIDNLRTRLPTTARVKRSGAEDFELTPIAEIRAGDTIRLRAGDTTPVDGTLSSSTAELDESILTGEFRPILKQSDDLIVSGSRAIGESFEYEATADSDSSALAQIRRMAEASLRSVPPLARLTDRVSRVFVGFVLVAGTLCFSYWHFIVGEPASALLNTIALLIAACPCALSLAIPTAYIAAVQRSFVSGCLCRDSGALERLADVSLLALDKTGTITRGKMSVRKAEPLDPDSTPEQILGIGRALQNAARVQHPIANAFRAAQMTATPASSIVGAKYYPGLGVTGEDAGGTRYWLGRASWLKGLGLEVDADAGPGSDTNAFQVYLARQRPSDSPALLGCFVLEDGLREDVRHVLQQINIPSVIITGDTRSNADAVASLIHARESHASCSPEEKDALIEKYQKRGEKICMVGDGINDAAALARADVGISFTHSANLPLESADILIPGGDLGQLAALFEISRRTRRTIHQNLALAFLYNAALPPLAFLGFIPPLAASLFMALSSVTVIANSLRLQRGLEDR